MKKFILFMAFVLLVVCSASAVYAVGLLDDPTEYTMEGISVSSENFASVFSGNPNARTVIQEDTLSWSEVLLTDIVVNDRNVSISANLKINDSLVVLPISGSLGAGYKTQAGINSAVVQVYETVNGYEILLFEIFNDTADDNLLLEYSNVVGELSGAPHIKLYIKDPEGAIYLFESAMPEAFKDINAFSFDPADKRKDALWAIKYVNASYVKIEDSHNIESSSASSRGLGFDTTWIPSSRNFLSYYLAGDFYEHSSQVRVKYCHENVTNSNTTWYAIMQVHEFTRVTSGSTYTMYYGVNPFEYYEPKISFVFGNQTQLVSAEPSGRMLQYRTIGDLLKNNGMSVSSIVFDSLDINPAVNMTMQIALQIIQQADATNRTITFGDNINSQYLEDGTPMVGLLLKQHYLSESTSHSGSSNNGHYFKFQVIVKHIAGTGTPNTLGALKVEYITYSTEDGSETPSEHDFQLNYTVSNTDGS